MASHENAQAVIVIFGALLTSEGTITPLLLRRIEGAIKISKQLKDPVFFATGKGPHAIKEADIIADYLASQSVSHSRIIKDVASTDSLQSAYALLDWQCEEKRKSNRIIHFFVATSPFHQPRCWLLLKALGLQAICPEMPADRPNFGFLKFMRLIIHECIAIPYDLALIILGRLFGTRFKL